MGEGGRGDDEVKSEVLDSTIKKFCQKEDRDCTPATEQCRVRGGHSEWQIYFFFSFKLRGSWRERS